MARTSARVLHLRLGPGAQRECCFACVPLLTGSPRLLDPQLASELLQVKRPWAYQTHHMMALLPKA
jgi:hypothetical protein